MSIFMDFYYVSEHVRSYQNQLKNPYYHILNLRDSHFIRLLAAILEMMAFWGSDFGRLLVCYLAGPILRESIEKPFVSIFLGFNHILTRILYKYVNKGVSCKLKTFLKDCS